MDLNNAFNYDITEQSFNKLALRYNEYVEHYASINKGEGNEKNQDRIAHTLGIYAY